MKGPAIVCALVNLVVVGFFSYVMLFVALFPWENAEDPTADDWLVPAGCAFFGTAFALLVAVIAGWRTLMLVAFAAQTIAALVLLGAFLEGSSHSDDRLVGAAPGVELAAGLAVWLSRVHSPTASGAS